MVRVVDTGVQRFAHGAERAWHRVLATGASHAMLPIRFAFGLIFVAHGSQKLFGWFGGGGPAGTAEAFEAMGFAPGLFFAVLAGLVEVGAGLLLALGLVTRLAAGLLFVQMLVAMFAVHWQHGFFLTSGAPAGGPGIEFTLALVAGLLAAVMYGGGAWSADRLLATRDRGGPGRPVT